MSICLSSILQVVDGGKQKPWCYLSLVGTWLGISRKVALRKLWDPEASVLLDGAGFVTRVSTVQPRFQHPPQLPAWPRSRYVGEKGHVQGAPLLRIMSQPLASSRVRNFLTWWLCMHCHDWQPKLGASLNNLLDPFFDSHLQFWILHPPVAVSSTVFGEKQPVHALKQRITVPLDPPVHLPCWDRPLSSSVSTVPLLLAA